MRRATGGPPRAGAPRRPRAPARVRAALVAAGLLAVLAPPLAGQGAGRHGAPVLRLAPAPRAEALGGALPLTPDDPFAVRANPAAAAGLLPGFAAAFRAHPGDVHAGALAAAFGAGPLRAGASLLYLDLGEVEERLPDPAVGGQAGLPTGRSFGGGELALGVAAAAALGPFDVGVGGSVVRTGWADEAEVSLAADVGAHARLLDGRLGVGVAALGLGPAGGPGADAPLPRVLRLGADLRLGSAADPRARIVAEARGPEAALHPAAGVEVRVASGGDADLILRAGWRGDLEADDALSPLGVGGTLALGRWRLDYAFRGVGLLGDAHELGVRWVRAPR